MASQRLRASLPYLLSGGCFALFSIWITVASFPVPSVPSGQDRGGALGLYIFVFPLAALGGQFLGTSLYRAVLGDRSRDYLVLVQLLTIFVVISVSLVYGWLAAPVYFGWENTKAWSGITLGIGVLLIGLQEGIHELRIRYADWATIEEDEWHEV
jgi:hypothetical protein